MISNSFISVARPVWSWHCFHKIWTWQSACFLYPVTWEDTNLVEF